MTRIRVAFVLLVLALALSGVLCDGSKGKESKRAAKPAEFKKVEKKSTHEKRDSSELTAVYNIKPKEEPFRPLYQYYPGVPLRGTRYITSAATPQITYSKPDAAIGIGSGGHSPPDGGSPAPEPSSGSTGGIQYASQSPYKPEGGIHYAPSSYKSAGNSLGVIQYASSAYRGPFITTYQQAPAGLVKVHPQTVYAPPPPPPPTAAQPPATVILPLHYGGAEQPLPPPQHHQQNQYAIAFPADYVRHYQQNLASPFPLHAAHTVPMVFAPSPPASPSPVKDQPFKQGAVHYFTLTPQPSSAAAAAVASHPQSGPMVITHFIPFYGPGPQQHQQFQQQIPAQFYFSGGHHQQKPAFAFTAFPHQQQAVQIAPKHHHHHIIGPIQMAAVGAASAATVPIIPFKPIVAAAPQLHQHHYHHPGATSYTRYSQSLSGGGGSSHPASAGADSNPIEVPSETGSSSSTLKLSPLYSPPASSSPSTSLGGIYAGATGGAAGKVSYTYASDANSVGPVYTHPGAIHYGTHLYQPGTKVVEIGSNRVTAGSAAIAGVAAPAYNPQQKTGGGGGSSSPVVKFP